MGPAPDCDDADPATHPGAPEVCGDGHDNDCTPGVGCRLAPDVYADDVAVGRWSRTPELYDGMYYTVAVAHDVGAQGTASVVVGYHLYSTESAEYSGAAFVLPGSLAADVVLDATAPALVGNNARDYLGYGAADAGDVNADGVDDLLVEGAYGWLFSGPLSGSSVVDATAELPHSRGVGASLIGIGDLDDDGFGDVLSLDQNIPRALWFRGPLSGAQTEANAAGQWTPDAESAASGDLDGDGRADVALGSEGRADDTIRGAGRVQIVNEPLTGNIDLDEAASATLVGGVEWSSIGEDLAVVGDVNGDGYDDLLAGGKTYYYPTEGIDQRTLAYLAYGPLSGDLAFEDAGPRFDGATGDEATRGVAVAAPGDMDGDGFAEVAIGLEYMMDRANEDYPGGALLYYGPVSDGTYTIAKADARIHGNAHWTSAGAPRCLAGGDVNGDGYGDLVMGRYGGGSTTEVVGWLILGGDGL